MAEKIYTVVLLLDEAMNQTGEEKKYVKNIMEEQGGSTVPKYMNEYLPFAVGLVNRLLGELFEINNSIRRNHGKSPLQSIPCLADSKDVIPYEYETISNIMVYGLAYWLLFQDEEQNMANVMNAMYEENKLRYAKATYAQIESW